MDNNSAETPRAPARAQPRGITTTPSKPRVRNPYIKASGAIQSSQPIAAAGTPNFVALSTSTPQTTPVFNPYAKSTSYASKSESKFDSTCESTKRTLDNQFANESGSQPSKKMTPTRTCNNNNGSAEAINLTVDDVILVDKSKTYTLYFDGGSRCNPGISGAGMVIYDEDNHEVWFGKKFLGDGVTNNTAEYHGLVTGLECAARLGIEKIRVRGDSDLVIKQVTGAWRCNKEHLQVLLQRALEEKQKFRDFDIAHVRRDLNKRADELANAAMDERVTSLGCAASSRGTPTLSQESALADSSFTTVKTCDTFDDPELDLELSFLQIPASPYKEFAAANNSAEAQIGTDIQISATFDDGNLEEELLSSQMPDTSQKGLPENDWLSGLSFLPRFEVERFCLHRNQSSLKDALSQIDVANTYDVISAIYKSESSSPTYDNFLKHCMVNQVKVDEEKACLFLFHAKFTSEGLELLPPEPADVKTRRIHRRFGSHRFLDLRIDEKWNLRTLKGHTKKFFTADNKIVIAGRKYAILYSNPSDTPVTFRLFAESGVGIKEDIDVTEAAWCCIPPTFNPQLSLTKYMKRMQLNFTESIPSLALTEGELEAIDDILGSDDHVMTDGCGLISREALDLVWTMYCDNLEQRKNELGSEGITYREGEVSHDRVMFCPHTSFQGRIGGIKGMFVLDSSLNGVKVQYRPSQLKYNTPLTSGDTASQANDDHMQSTVDVMEWDKKSPHAHLNTGFIQLLEQRGAPNEFFLSLAKHEVDELLQVSKTYELLQSRYQARVFSRENQDMFDDDILLRMLHARVPLDEPVMLCKVNKFISKELEIFKEKSKFPVVESKYLRMFPDHTGLLESGEAYVALGDACLEVGRLGEIIAIRSPSYFSSDIRKLKVVSKKELTGRCEARGKFFADIKVGLVLSTQGSISEAELMSGGDFDGDKAWCCWNHELVDSIEECPEQHHSSVVLKDPWKERAIDFNDPNWTNQVIIYTMHHRRDKQDLGIIVTILEAMRDDPRIPPHQVNDMARKAFVQVDNPYTSQWADHDRKMFSDSRRPHWHIRAQPGNQYTSNKVLGQLFDLLNEAAGKEFDYNEIEPEMNQYVRQAIERAEQKDAAQVKDIHEEMLKRLKDFNQRLKVILESKDDSELEKRLRKKAKKDLYRQHYSEITSLYQGAEATAFAILYAVTYFESREKMMRFKETPYVFAWKVGQSHITRLIADGYSGGIGISCARGHDPLVFKR